MGYLQCQNSHSTMVNAAAALWMVCTAKYIRAAGPNEWDSMFLLRRDPVSPRISKVEEVASYDQAVGCSGEVRG